MWRGVSSWRRRRKRPASLELDDADGATSWAKTRHKPQPTLLAWSCRFVFFGSFLLEILPMMRFLFLPLLLMGVLITCWKLLHFRRWGDEMPHIKTFFLCAVLLVLELTVENFCVWVVSATDQKRMKRIAALQDNVEILVRFMMSWHPMLHRLVFFPWVHTLQFLSSAILLSLSVLWEQVPYSGFRIMSRFVLTLVISRTIRIICFMVTVLPSPKPGCYLRRFPPVPASWMDFIRVGFQEMMGKGGCNDLIFSGHCNLWTLTPLLYHAYYQRECCWLLWMALCQTAIRTVLEHHHYSIDMFLAVVVTSLIWRELEWICPNQETISNVPSCISQKTAQCLTIVVIGLLLTVTVLILVSSA